LKECLLTAIDILKELCSVLEINHNIVFKDKLKKFKVSKLLSTEKSLIQDFHLDFARGMRIKIFLLYLYFYNSFF
jgi:hypothetical protein